LRGEGVGRGRGRTSSYATPHTHLPKAQGSTKWVGRVALITRKENHNQGECMGVATPDVFLGGEYTWAWHVSKEGGTDHTTGQCCG
jgi:hypothetical protein